MTTKDELRTTPAISGATPLACAIANRIANLDGLSPYINDEFLAAIARCCCESCKSGDSRRQNALTASPQSSHSWVVHFTTTQQAYSLQNGYKLAGRISRKRGGIREKE